MAQWLDRLPLTVVVPGLIPGRGNSCELSLLVRSLLASKVFLRVLLFSFLHQKQTGESSDYLQNIEGRGGE